VTDFCPVFTSKTMADVVVAGGDEPLAIRGETHVLTPSSAHSWRRSGFRV